MADSNQPTNPPGESREPDSQPANPLGPEISGLSTETTSRDTNSSHPKPDSSFPTTDTSLPPIDTTLPPIDSSIPQFDGPSLPAIDTSLPPIDTTLPATDTSLPALAGHSSAADAGPANTGNDHLGTTTHFPPESNNNVAEQHGVHGTAPPARPSSNGMYHQPQQHPPPPQQHPQPPPFHQQSSGMSHNAQQSSTPMNAGSMQPAGHHPHEQQIPQAPIGSPLPTSLPPMPQMVQYMGYSPNVPQMGVNSNAPMRYQMQGDANRMLSGGRHKKEVKRRTKTGCLTCRKRRIKVRICCIEREMVLGVDGVVQRARAGTAKSRFGSHQNPAIRVGRSSTNSFFHHNTIYALF